MEIKFVALKDRHRTSIIEVDEALELLQPHNIVRTICHVKEQISEEQTKEVTQLLLDKLNA